MLSQRTSQGGAGTLRNLRESDRTDHLESRLRHEGMINSVMFDIPCIRENKISLAGVAKRFNLSEHHFHRIFKEYSGENFTSFGRRVRLEYAVRRLRAHNQSILDIALSCGYDSHEGFSRAFKQHFGFSPQDMRGRMLAMAPSVVIPASATRYEQIPDQTALRQRHIGLYSELQGPTESFLRRAWAPQGHGDPVRPFILYYDDPVIPQHRSSRAEICCQILQTDHAVAGLEKVTIPGGRYRIYRHRGPYSSIHAAFLAFAAQNADICNFTLTEHICRVNFLCVAGVVDEAELINDICIRVED